MPLRSVPAIIDLAYCKFSVLEVRSLADASRSRQSENKVITIEQAYAVTTIQA